MTAKANPTLHPLISTMRSQLALISERVVEAESYAAEGKQNSTIGTIAGLDRELDELKALYGAAMAIHRLQAP